MLDDRRIRIRTSYQWIRIQEAQKHPDPQHTASKACPVCRYVDGAKAASSILSVDQKNVGALFLRGFCLYHKDNVDRAITHFQQVKPPPSPPPS